MATKQQIESLKKASVAFDSLDLSKLERKNLGEASLAAELEPRLQEIRRIRDIASKYASSVHGSHVDAIRGVLEQVKIAIEDQAKRSTQEYIAQAQPFLQNMDSRLEDSRMHLAYFVTAAIIERGFLEDEGIRVEYDRTVENLKKETEKTLASVKEEADKAVAGAKELAEQIEQRARLTASKISVKEAQEQFTGAVKDLSQKVKLWSKMTGGSMAILIAVPFVFMLAWPISGDESWPVALYHTLLRVLVLSAAAGFSTFCIRMLRAHIHLVEKNKHRVRVANSVDSFVNSAIEVQQRDLILTKLVEAVVDFGDSGIIKHEKDEFASPALSGDLIGRILSAISSKKA